MVSVLDPSHWKNTWTMSSVLVESRYPVVSATVLGRDGFGAISGALALPFVDGGVHRVPRPVDAGGQHGVVRPPAAQRAVGQLDRKSVV